MARWRLKQKHYLMVEGWEWQYTETDRTTGRPKRVNFPVPRYLDPGDFADCNYVTRGQDGVIVDGEIVVSNNADNPRDIRFVGDPTPDMEPLDDEAREISDKFKDVWKHPIENINDQGYSGSIIRELEGQIASLKTGQSVSVGGVDPSQFTALQNQVAELMKQNTMLMEQLISKASVRRV